VLRVQNKGMLVVGMSNAHIILSEPFDHILHQFFELTTIQTLLLGNKNRNISPIPCFKPFPWCITRKLFTIRNQFAKYYCQTRFFSISKSTVSIVTNPSLLLLRMSGAVPLRSAAVISLLKASGDGARGVWLSQVLCAARRVLLTWDIRRYMHTALSPEASSADLLLQQTTTSSLSTANPTNQPTSEKQPTPRAHIHQRVYFSFYTGVRAGEKRRHKVNVWSAPNIQLSLLTQALQ
jgi:hypothetical protein